MNKRLIIALILPLFPMVAMADMDWKPTENAMLTRWGMQVTPENAWNEYPRPQMVRENWTSLNGLWSFKTTGRGAPRPEEWEGNILVPFALETPLSGVGRRLGDEEALWYFREFEYGTTEGKRVLLHFEGVDYACQVWLNGGYAGDHRGGNLPFQFDVSGLVRSGRNELLLRVIDDTDKFDRYQLRGKQLRDNKGIWYTPSSGIWQSVWMETVPETYLDGFRIEADMNGQLHLDAAVAGSRAGVSGLRLSVMDGDQVVGKATAEGKRIAVSIENPKLWSPDQPHLYDLVVELMDADGSPIDTVRSYAGFRTLGKARDKDGHWRFTLNGETIFQLGPLDQGWWPDGFLNPPSDAAIQYEMAFLKAAGFNMIRKHKKVEPRRYYYHADKFGFLVWQDQVSGGAGPNEWPKWKRLQAVEENYTPRNPNWWSSEGDKLDADWPDWAHGQYMTEFKVMIDTLYNHPSVVVWTAFNERWGQHRSMEVGKWVQSYDRTRLLNIASGGNFFPIGDIADEHNYPHPRYPLGYPLYDEYIKVVGEFGGHGFPEQGHLWDPNKHNWGYGGLPESKEELIERYRTSIRMLKDLKDLGIAAGVYTQTTDVEGEINGLLTYDREVEKIAPEQLREIHELLQAD